MRASAHAHAPKARNAMTIGLMLMVTMSAATTDKFAAVDDSSTGNGVMMDGDSMVVTTPSPTATYGFPQDLWDPKYDCANAAAKNPNWCQHGSELYHTIGYWNFTHPDASNNQHPYSCATCTCSAGPFIDQEFSPTGQMLEREYYIGAGVDETPRGAECCPGWNGTRCEICTTTKACPPKVMNNSAGELVTVEAKNCTKGQLLPTVEETKDGKRFSCTCGGGEDITSKTACQEQLLTAWEFKMFGSGFAGDEIRIESRAYMGVHRQMDLYARKDWIDKYPDIIKYEYPENWNANITGCVATTGKCMDVPFTDVGEQNCINWVCEDTQIKCPPEGYETCPGWDGVMNCDCMDPPDLYGDDPNCQKNYYVPKCAVVPANDIGFSLSCLIDETHDGSGLHVCYFTQPHSVSPLSMTCTVGNCLYEDPEDIVYPETEVIKIAFVGGQMVMLALLSVAVLGCCALFNGTTNLFDWATTKSTRDAAAATAGTAEAKDDSVHALNVAKVEAAGHDVESDTGNMSAPLLNGSGSSSALLPASDAKLRADANVNTMTAGETMTTDIASPILSWSNLSLWVPDKAASHPQAERQILKSVTGMAGRTGSWEKGGGITALMGPSGAGKTSLLDLLARRHTTYSRVEGDVRVNGHVLSHAQMKGISGYVTQHDVLPGIMTVREHLLFHARLRLGDAVPLHVKQERVCDVLDELGLGHINDSVIGDEFIRGISGGEKRRVSIASELLAYPALLFLDEPTTGLDASNAINVVRIAARVAAKGTTVIMSIHQPRSDIFELFHRVVLMAKGGKVVYCGDASQAAGRLQAEANATMAPQISDDSRLTEETSAATQAERFTIDAVEVEGNPGDVILDLACGPYARDLVRAFEASDQRTDLIHAIGSLSAAADRRGQGARSDFSSNVHVGFHTQVLVLSQRLLKKAVRHPMLLALHYGGSVFMAITLGSIFSDMTYDLQGAQDRIGVLFFILFYLALLGMSSLPVWRDEYLLFAHERASEIYGNLSYYLSIVLFDLVLVRAVPPFAFAFISYEWMNLQEYCDECLYEFTLILVLANVTFALWSMGIGALRLSTVVSNVVGGLVTMVFMLTGGFMVDREALKSNPLTEFLLITDPMAYAFEAMMINQFHAAETEDGQPLYYLINTTYCASSFPVISVDGDTILSTFNYATTHKVQKEDLIALACMALVLVVTIYMVLVWTGEMSNKFARQLFQAVPKVPIPTNVQVTVDELTVQVSGPFNSSCGTGPTSVPVPIPRFTVEWDDGDNDRPTSIAYTPAPSANADADNEAEGASQSVGPGAVLTWEDICLWVPAKGGRWFGEKQVIQSVSGCAGPFNLDDDTSPPGDVCALMGPSGAGKTSLLDILAGRKNQGRTTGTVRLNGRPLNAKQRRAVSGYVVQEDILPASLTVSEQLELHAQLRMLTSVSFADKKERAREVVMQLGLSSISDVTIGNDMQRGISGGEKRRVSIAVELLTQPPVLFLDEPTSGLDSTASINVVNLVSQIASHGTTVIMSIHQPRLDIFTQIRRVGLLARGGHLAYMGDARLVAEHMRAIQTTELLAAAGSENPADYILDVVTSTPREQLVRGFRESRQMRVLEAQLEAASSAHLNDGEGPAAVQNKARAPFHVQFKLLAVRALRTALRNPMVLTMQMIAAACVAVTLGVTFFDINQYNDGTAGIQDRLGLFFFILIYFSLMSLSSLPIWRDEQRIFIHERAAGAYGTLAYFTANIVCDLIPYRILPPAVFTAIW
mmetsp:Transcript_68689/g.191581  ORF Transcript_68689/g.191581 Transcript_68689/m.191581 type:complete len:1747 (-) Transcript_68689:1259-6499(-)